MLLNKMYTCFRWQEKKETKTKAQMTRQKGFWVVTSAYKSEPCPRALSQSLLPRVGYTFLYGSPAYTSVSFRTCFSLVFPPNVHWLHAGLQLPYTIIQQSIQGWHINVSQIHSPLCAPIQTGLVQIASSLTHSTGSRTFSIGFLCSSLPYF